MNLLFTCSLAALVTAIWLTATCQASDHDSHSPSINALDLQASYLQLAAKYGSKRKKKPTPRIGQLEIVSLAEADSATQPSRVSSSTDKGGTSKRGVVIPLRPIGGYPKMLGQTYNAAVGIGTPPQPFNLTIDTGSTLTWVINEACSPAKCPIVTKKNKYNATESSTAKSLGRPDHESYGDGEAEFDLYEDVVHLSSLTVTGTIGVASNTSETESRLDHDGLLGLGRKPGADPPTLTDVLHRSDAKTQDEVIALALGANAHLEIGGFDYVKYSDMSYFSISSDEGWAMESSALVAKGDDADQTLDLWLDSGSSVAVLPQSHVEAIMKRPDRQVQSSGTEPIIYSMPCETKLGLELVLPGGKKVDIPDENVLMKSNDATMPGCLSLIVGSTNPFIPSVAGTPLLKSVYMVMKKTQSGDLIGVAPISW